MAGYPQLMMSFTNPSQFDLENHVGARDRKFHVDRKHKAEIREDIDEPKTHEGRFL